MTLDFVGIGDITTDAFIELDQNYARVERGKGGEQLVMAMGEKLPYRDLVVVPAVGNASNAAVAAARLGLKSALVSNLGSDKNGKDMLAQLRREHVHTTYVRINEGTLSNYHYVLRYGAERTILIKHQDYPYSLPSFPKPPRYLYFSSIGERGIQLHHDIAQYVKKNPETKLVFQPGTFQLSLGAKKLKDLYAVTELFFCNKEEAQRLLNIETADPILLLDHIAALGPKIVVITDGPRGAYARDHTGQHWFMPPYPDPAPPVDRTGAGDSFAATFTIALALGHPVRTALLWAPINSMSVVQQIGAQKGLCTETEIETHLAHAPKYYRPKLL